jgi:hypothetical protein
MPQVSLLLDAAALGAPLVLFGILIWTEIEERLEIAARDHLVRSRLLGPRGLSPVALTLVIPASAPAIAPQPGARTAA